MSDRVSSATATVPTTRVAAVQTVSGGDVGANLAAIEPWVVEAARQGAKLVLLPEYFGIFGARATDKVSVREADGEGAQQAWLSRVARDNDVWLIGGSVPLAVADPARVRSACLVYDRTGRRVARYDKMHLFAFSARRGALRRGAHHRARRGAGGRRHAVRPHRVVGVLRRALSGALPAAIATSRCWSCPPRSPR